MTARCAGLAIVVVIFACAAPAVHGQPDATPCDNNGAYDTTTGTASCGGFNVEVKALVCGDGFSQGSCVAKWVNGAGENEWYYFMGAGAGMDASVLPAACSALPQGLAMVQYYPDKQGCYPAADLAGTTIAYTAGSGPTPTSVTLNFAEHSDGAGATRNGYIKITCSATEAGFTTIGDSNQGSFYEVHWLRHHFWTISHGVLSFTPPPPSPTRRAMYPTQWPYF